ncbi:FxsA family protein [Paracoccus luteus]|uniref:FxsA family protein n=1 Tax=Paracoccus luteus TaxID=2508543 RepID=UPI00106FD01F|nr:FxsA family protein [Paracoccus luteus]
MWLLIPFVVLPVVEIALFLQAGALIGFWPTIGLVILSAVAGSALMRRQGAATMADMQAALRDLRDPTAPLAHGALIMLAGALLLMPGFFSDALGLALLVPPVRRAVIHRLGARMTARAGFGMRPGPGVPPRGPAGEPWPGNGGPGHGTVIDADFSVVPPDHEAPPRDPPRPPSGWTRH